MKVPENFLGDLSAMLPPAARLRRTAAGVDFLRLWLFEPTAPATTETLFVTTPVRPLRIPRPPPGMPRRMRGWYVVIAAIVSVVAAAVPLCPVHDSQGRALWRVDIIHDGDTVTCVDDARRPQKIRLVGIDSPELNQPFGRESRAALAAKIGGGSVRVEGDARDQYGRLLGTLWIGARSINRELVTDGWAWVFEGYSPDPDLLDAESAARAARRGLWAVPHPQSPADWRREHPALR